MRRIAAAAAAVWLAAALAAGPALAAPEAGKAGEPEPEKIVIVLKTDDAASMRAFFIRMGYRFVTDYPDKVTAEFQAACARSQPGGALVGFVQPPIPIRPWPPPYVCVHPNPFTPQQAERFCTMAADHLQRKLVVLANEPEKRKVVCGTPEAAM